MKRRTFLKTTTLGAILLSGCTNKQNQFWLTIENIQNIILPQSKYGPSAKEIHASQYLQYSSIHQSFDSRDLILLKQGVKYLANQNFNNAPNDKQIKIFNNFTKTNLGNKWINLLVYYTLEALFADPIYQGNYQQKGWKWINHSIGYPRPTKTFGNTQNKA